MRLLKYFLVISVAAIFTRCGFQKIKNEAPQINEVKSGDKFTIVLPEDHSTGYIWQLNQEYDHSIISQINEVWHGNDKGIYFNLESLAAGQTTLTFISRKYTDTADVKHFIVKIGSN